MMSAIGKKRYFKTNSALKETIRMIDGIIFPGEYVAVDRVADDDFTGQLWTGKFRQNRILHS